MSLLPKSIHRCRRYPTKFNSGRDIPVCPEGVIFRSKNLLLFPASDQLPQSERKVRSRERLGGLLRFYHREAA